MLSLDDNRMIETNEILDAAPVGFLVFNEEKKIILISNNFYLFDVINEKVDEAVLGKLIDETEIFSQVELNGEIKELIQGKPFEKELISFTSFQNDQVKVLVKGTPITRKSKIIGGILTLEDITVNSDINPRMLVQSGILKNFISGFSEKYFITDLSGKIKFVSPLLEKIADEKGIKTVNKNIEEFLSRSDVKDFRSVLQSVRISKKIGTGNFTINYPGNIGLSEFSFYPFFNSSKEIEFFIVSIHPGNKEQPVPENEEIAELRSIENIVEGLTEAVIGLDREGKISFWSNAAAKLFGFNRSEVFGKFIGKLIPDYNESLIEGIDEELEKEKKWESKFSVKSKKGINKTIALKIGTPPDESGIKYVILANDITIKDKIETELRRSEEKFRSIVTNTHEYIFSFDLTGNITFVNPQFIQVFGYKESELFNKKFTDLVRGTVPPELVNLLAHNSKRENLNTELPLKTKEGSTKFVMADIIIVTDFNNNPLYYNAVLSDITEKKKAEQDLLMTQAVFRASQDGIAVQKNRQLILVNESMVNMFGFNSEKEVIGIDPLDLVDNKNIPEVADYIKMLEKRIPIPGRYEFIAKRKDRDDFFAECSSAFYEINGELFIVSVYRDITKQKQAQDDLLKSEQRYRNLTENLSEGMWTSEIIDGKLQPVLYTEGIKKISGFETKDFFKDQRLWYKIIHPDDLHKVLSGLKRLFNDATRNYDEIDLRIISNTGNIVWTRNKITLIRNEQKRIERIYGLVSDITLSKKAEQDLKKSASNLQELNEAKDRFISIISHDLRSPFNSILGYTDLLLKDEEMDENERTEYVKFIRQSSQSMLDLVNSLLDWTRLQTGRIKFEPQRINIKYIVDKSVNMLSGAAFKKKIDLISEVEGEVFVHADENLVLQVFNNLVSNAIKFTPAEGKIIISAALAPSKRSFEFKVRDTGVGIKKDDIEKLFKVDTKFTTFGTSGEKGSGLGLSLCYDIVKKHGGDFNVESEIGKGSTFKFTIPIASTKVVLADDKKTDRILYSKLLKNLLPEYDILEAVNGKEAMELIRKNSPALLITDHNMPEMSGYEVVKSIIFGDLQSKPPIIILSSDINDSIRETYKELGIDFVFNKPVNITTFKYAIDNSMKKAIHI